jgi:hypothetical protein
VTDDFSGTLATRLVGELDCPDEVAGEVAAKADTLRADYEDAGFGVQDFIDHIHEAPYEEFARQWNWAVGDRCHELDDCTDSRPYRLEGFGDVGATN